VDRAALADVQEAQIGVLFVLAATGGLLLLANNPHGGEHLRDLLAGQILWVRYDQLLVPAIGTALIAALLVTKRAQLHPLLFYVVFALAVTASVQLVGVYLVFASLIVPASPRAASAGAGSRRRMVWVLRLRGRPAALDSRRPAVRRDDRLVHDGLRDPHLCTWPACEHLPMKPRLPATWLSGLLLAVLACSAGAQTAAHPRVGLVLAAAARAAWRTSA